MGSPKTGTIRTNLQIPPCRVNMIGEAASDMLSTGRGGRVLACVSQAAYLVLETGELLWQAVPTVPLHRRGLRVSLPLPSLAEGASFWIRDGVLLTDSGTALEFGSAPVWKTPRLPAGEAVALARLPGLLTSVYLSFLEWPKPAGMGNLIPAILQAAFQPSRYEPAGGETPLRENFWPLVRSIVVACLKQDFDLILENAAPLVGLGSGLTPSGDDFLGGLFFAIELLRQTYPKLQQLRTWNNANFILQCQSQTNLISFNFLKDLAAGYALEPLHSFANALFSGQPADRCLPFAGELVGVGHSTGWDLLAGFLAGMSVIFPAGSRVEKNSRPLLRRSDH
jgi:Protein of unknown function (DUF2877)